MAEAALRQEEAYMRCLVQQSSSAPMLEAGAEELQLGLLLFGEFDADGELTLTLTLT